MAKIRKKPTKLFRGYRWESDFNESFESMGYLEIKKGFFWEAPEMNDLREYIDRKHNLAICVRAICMNETDEWGISEQYYPDKPCKIDEFEKYYFDNRKAMLDQIQKQHIVDVGWVIQTYSKFNQVDNDKWWQIGSAKATKERQQLWRYYHNVVKYEDEKRRA